MGVKYKYTYINDTASYPTRNVLKKLLKENNK